MRKYAQRGPRLKTTTAALFVW